MSTFYLQLDLMTFFDLYHGGNHERAYSVSTCYLATVARQWNGSTFCGFPVRVFGLFEGL